MTATQNQDVLSFCGALPILNAKFVETLYSTRDLTIQYIVGVQKTCWIKLRELRISLKKTEYRFRNKESKIFAIKYVSLQFT